MKRLFFLIIVLLLFFEGVSPPAVVAQSPISLEIQAGLDSFYKSNMWGPIRVTLANAGPDLQVTLQAEDANYWSARARYTYPVDLPSQSRKQIVFDIPFRQGDRVTINVFDANDELLTSQDVHVQQLNQDDFLVGVVASDSSLLNALAGLNAPKQRADWRGPPAAGGSTNNASGLVSPGYAGL